MARYSDLTPNVGIFWYFFMEVFDRFIPYFLFVMHIHPCIYVVPIFLRMAYVSRILLQDVDNVWPTSELTCCVSMSALAPVLKRTRAC